jgi:hypothetical protein
MITQRQRAIALNFHQAIQMLAAPGAEEELRHAAGDSDPSVRMYYVATYLTAVLNGFRIEPGDPRLFQLVHDLNRAIFFARELRREMEADAECAPQVKGLNANSLPTNLPTRIFVVMAVAELELSAELDRIEADFPDSLAGFLAASRAAFGQLAEFAPKEER